MADKTTKSANTTTTTTSSKTTANGGDAGEAEMQARMDKAEEQGFIGVEVDPTPNEAYTVSGVTSGMPTPETDAQASRDAREATGGSRTAIEQNEDK